MIDRHTALSFINSLFILNTLFSGVVKEIRHEPNPSAT